MGGRDISPGRSHFPLDEARRRSGWSPSGAPPARSCSSRERVARAVVTGGASGIGAALVARLRAEGFDVESLDLVTGFDVADPDAWDDIEPVDVACLNAGVLGGPPDPAELTLDGYRRAIGVNVDGVVLGVRRLARVMPAGGRIVCTASLAGLTGSPTTRSTR